MSSLRWIRIATALACLVAQTVLAQAPVRYTVLIAGTNAGSQTSTVHADGVREFTFEYNDRGRGPKLNSRVRLAADGTPIFIDTQGNDYLKAPVQESFTVEKGLARWNNGAENDEQQLTGKAFYVSLQAIPEEIALLANALLRAPGRSLPLLPAGTASVQRTGEATLEEGGRKRHVTAYEVSGLGFSPTGVWLDDDGSFFASVSSWVSVIREGWASTAAQLLEQQDNVDAQRTRETAHQLTQKPAGPLAIVNANLFDAVATQSLPDTTIVIEGNRIKAVGPRNQVQVPANAEIIDARGKAVLPGLWDMHVHIQSEEGIQHIAAGVTTVRDLANDPDQLQAIRRNIDAGDMIGPRIMRLGIIDGRGPLAGPTKMLIDNPQEAHAAVDTYKQWGYEGIKIYSSVKKALVPDLIRYAHGKGLRVDGHVPAYMTAREFVEAGADELQHINFVFLNFFDDVQDTRSPARFTAVADRAATLDLDSKSVRDFVQLLKDRGTVIDPTVSVFHGMFTDRPGTISADYAAIAARLPPQVRRPLLAGGLPVPAGKDQRFRDSAQALLRMIKLLHDAGIPLVPGTDSLPGFTLHRELELYVAAGIPAPEVLRIATLGAAQAMKRDRDNGSVSVGKLADLVLVDGDPARTISDIRRTSLVIKDGNVYDPAALYRSIGVH
ncbi:amidohydrolase family protein [Povalibacter sp.]|uniref:amidohydrolase family protein n=1 Tax=Povalibacter sp. TaxID=1962978 RepID=UPI002F3E8C4B